MIHWSRTTRLRHLKVCKGETPAGASQCLECLTEQLPGPHCSCVHTHRWGSAWPAGEGRGWSSNTQHSLFTQVPIQALHSAPVDLWLAVFIVCTVCSVHTGVVLYYYKLEDTGITTAWGPLAWEGEKKKPSSQKPGDSATMSNVRKSHTDTGKNPPVEIFSWPKRFIYFHITEWSLVYFRYL